MTEAETLETFDAVSVAGVPLDLQPTVHIRADSKTNTGTSGFIKAICLEALFNRAESIYAKSVGESTIPAAWNSVCLSNSDNRLMSRLRSVWEAASQHR